MAPPPSNITSSLARTAATARSYGRDTLAPALGKAGKTALKLGQEHVVPALSGAAQTVRNLDIKQAGPVAVAAKSWIVAHPGQTVLYVASLSTLAFPGFVAGPLLGAAGFAGTGIKAGSAAATYQAFAGPTVAKGVFATLQSAGAGGSGAAAVCMFTKLVGSVGVGAPGAAAVARHWRRGGRA